MTISKGLRKNREINSPEIRLVGVEGRQDGVVSFSTAMSLAQEIGFDLVEVAPGREGQPPVCRLMDYGKYLYQQHKNQDAAKKHQHKVTTKEVRLTPRIGAGDFDVKLRMIKNFLSQGDKVKVAVRFRGRELSYREQGMDILKKVEQETAELCAIEQSAKFEGRQAMMVLAPLKKSGA